jgi:hypothetical protein
VTLESSSEATGKSLWSRIGFKRVFLLAIIGVIGLFWLSFSLFKNSLRKEVLAQIEQIKARGEPVILEQLGQSYRAGLTGPNAAEFLQQAFTTISTNASEQLDRIISDYNEADRVLSDELRNKLERVLQENLKTFGMLEKAFASEQAIFPLNWSSGYSMMLRHLSYFRTLARLLHGRAIWNLENGRPSDGLHDICQILKLGSYLERETILVSQMVRYSVCHIGLEGAQTLLNKGMFSPEDLGKVQTQLLSGMRTESLTKSFMAERVYGIEFLLDPARLPGVTSFSQTGLAIYRGTGLLYYDQRIYLRLIEEMIEATRFPFPEALDKASLVHAQLSPPPDNDDGPSLPLPRVGTLAYMLLPGVTNCMNKQALLIANGRMTYIACELEKHALASGQYPPTLTDLHGKLDATHLVDPFSGLLLRYQPRESGFLLYSVGPDRTDDEGKKKARLSSRTPRGVLANQGPPETGQYDVLFQVQHSPGPRGSESHKPEAK